MRITTELVGMITLCYNPWLIHFGVPRRHWEWGKYAEDHTKCMDYFGLGPLMLLMWKSDRFEVEGMEE